MTLGLVCDRIPASASFAPGSRLQGRRCPLVLDAESHQRGGEEEEGAHETSVFDSRQQPWKQVKC